MKKDLPKDDGLEVRKLRAPQFLCLDLCMCTDSAILEIWMRLTN